MNPIKILSFLVLASTFYLLSSAAASAAVSCQPIYGGGQTCVQIGEVRIDKKIENPKTKALEDKLESAKATFTPDQTVTFKIIITNTGSASVAKVTVQDIFPQFVQFLAGPGNFDNNSKVLTFDILNLASNESRDFVLSAKVGSLGQLPIGEAIVCVVNQANALIDNSVVSSDNVEFCIEKKAEVLPATKGGLKVLPPQKVTATPSTGPEALALIALIPTGLAGYFLRKRTNPPSSAFGETSAR